MAATSTQTARRTVGLSATADARAVPSARRRLVPLVDPSRHPDGRLDGRLDDRLAGWLVSLGITALAFFLRTWHLGYPHKFLFDETYYAKDAWSLWHHGYVTNYTTDADDKILAGHLTGIFAPGPSFIVHPEVGKWLIGLSEHLLGMTPYGWRFAPAVVGSLLVLVVTRLARRLTGSTLLGGLAGLLLCFDGLELVMSRLALLDIFLAFFLLLAVSCLVADRDWGRLRLARLVPPGWQAGPADWGPVRGLRWRPWRLAAGLSFGLALGCKWNAVYPLLAFGLLVWAWDTGARRSLGVRRAWLRSLVVDALPAVGYLVVVSLVVYVATWTGWLMHAQVYELNLSNTQYTPYWGAWTRTQPHGFVPQLLQALRALWHYHLALYSFHTHGLIGATHLYQSTPQGWPLINRIVDIDAQLDIAPGAQGCQAAAGSTCLREIVLLGTPALWWGGVLGLLFAVYGWLGKRDWRFGLVVVGAVSTWLPWIRYDDRPIFYFYAVAMIPFTVLGLTLCAGTLMGGPGPACSVAAGGTAVAGAFVLLVVLNFAWYWPVWTDGLLTTRQWLDRIWFRSWI